jgi:chitinase
MAFVKENNLAGAFLWSVDLDDFTGEWCEQGKFPLLNSIKSSLRPPKPHSSENSSKNLNCENFYLFFINFLFLILLY